MADIDKRLKYYNGQFLQQQDFTAEQEYHLDRLRRHNRQLHLPGIAEGLTVTATVGATSASVSPGTALDREGRQIVLTEPFNVAFASLANQWVLVVISYDEEESDQSTVGDEGMTRWTERPDVDVIPESGAPPEDVRIRLARLRIAANGTIAEHDTTVRTLAGVRLRPEETVERLRLSRQGVSANLWPVLSSGAASRADLAGDLNVTGNILVGGTVDGRDIAADAGLNDTHRGRTDNPHGVTAAQVGAIASIAGVSNPGGNITLNGASGISIAGNDSTNTITITGGSPTSIDGVSNPGGNIDFVGQGGISITPDDAGNLIAFSTSPGAIGALPAGDYLKRSLNSIYFNTNDGNGATRTVTCNFLPKYVLATTSINASLGGYYHTYISPGLARIESTGSWFNYNHRAYIYRYTGAPYFSQTSYAGYGGIGGAYFYDYTQSPAAQNYLLLSITQVTSTGFTVTFERTNYTGREVYFWLETQLAVFG